MDNPRRNHLILTVGNTILENCYEQSGKQSFAPFSSKLTFLKKMRVMKGSSMQ